MKAKIPDEKIKSYVQRYNTGEIDIYPSIIELLSLYMYNYPRIIYHREEDTCSDFYEYMLNHLKSILHLYKKGNAKFLTWFTVVLRNRYLNFIRESKKKNNAFNDFDLLSLDFDCEMSGGLHSVIGDKKNYHQMNKLKYDSLIDDILRNLKDKYRLFFHLYYIETLRPEDVGFISIYLNSDIRNVLIGIDRIRGSMIEKYELKSKFFQRLSVIYYDMLKYQENGNRYMVEKLKNTRNKLLKEYQKVKLNPSYESINSFLNMPLGSISTGISRMKKAVGDFLKEYDFEKM